MSLSYLFLIAALLVAAGVALLLARARRDVVDLARLTAFFAVITLIGAGISAVVSCYTLLFASEVSLTVPIEVTQARLPDGVIDPQSVATVVSGGADRASLVLRGLTLPTRLLLLGGEIAGAVMIGAVALVALRAARALRSGDIFGFAPRAIMATAAFVVAGGLAWSVLHDIGAWRAGVEALTIHGWGAEGALADALNAGNQDPALILAEHGWLMPPHLTITLPFWPLSIGLGLALVGTAFRTGRGLRKDVAVLEDDVRGLI